MPIPKNTEDEYLTIFDQACYRIIPDIADNKPEE